MTAAPPEMASSMVLRETPAFADSERASQTAMLVTATATWLQSLTVCPAPTGPQ